MTTSLTELTVSLDDLSDEGLDAMLRLALGTDTRQVDNWESIGTLIDKFKVSLSPTSLDPVQWNATVDEPEFITEFGETPRTAVAKAVIHALFRAAPSLRCKRRMLDEMLSQDFKESWIGYVQKGGVEGWADREAPDGTPEGDALVILTIRSWDAV